MNNLDFFSYQNKLKNSYNYYFLLIIILFIFILIFLYLQIKQIFYYLQLSEKYYELTIYVDKQNYIFNKKIELNKKLKDLEDKKLLLESNVCKIFNIFENIVDIIPKDTCIDEFSIINNNLIIYGKSQTWLSLSVFMDKLNSKLGFTQKHKTWIDDATNFIAYEIYLSNINL